MKARLENVSCAETDPHSLQQELNLDFFVGGVMKKTCQMFPAEIFVLTDLEFYHRFSS